MPCRPRPKEQPRAGLRAQRPARHPHPRPRLGRTKAAVAAGPLRAARTRRGVSPHRSGLGGVGRAPRPGPRARPGPTRRRVGRKRRPPAPRLDRPPSPPLRSRSSAPSSSRWRRRRLSRPRLPALPHGFASLLSGRLRAAPAKTVRAAGRGAGPGRGSGFDGRGGALG